MESEASEARLFHFIQFIAGFRLHGPLSLTLSPKAVGFAQLHGSGEEDMTRQGGRVDVKHVRYQLCTTIGGLELQLAIQSNRAIPLAAKNLCVVDGDATNATTELA